MDKAFGLGSAELACGLEEGPPHQQNFFNAMCSQYKHPIFLTLTTDNWQDFSFYVKYAWEQRNNSDKALVPLPAGEEGPWSVILCIGRDEKLETFSATNVVHFLVPQALVDTSHPSAHIFHALRNGLPIRAISPG